MSIKRCLGVGLTITGTIVGVGFASGREVVSFFARFGFLSCLFCLLAGVFFGALTYMVFSISQKAFITSQNGIKIIDEREGKVDKIFNWVLFVSQIAIASAMFAGLDSILNMIKANVWISLFVKFIVFLLVYLFLRFTKKGVFSANTILSIVMFVSIIILFLSLTIKNGVRIDASFEFDKKLFIYPLLYVGMNVFTAYPILEDISLNIKSSERVVSSVFVSIFVGVSLCLVCLCILLFGKSFINEDMVMVSVAGSVNKLFKIMYIILLALCILTTLVSTIYGAARFLKIRTSKSSSIFISLCLSMLLSFIGFSKIIDYLYLMIGFVCLLVIVTKFVDFRLKRSKNTHNRVKGWRKKNAKSA